MVALRLKYTCIEIFRNMLKNFAQQPDQTMLKIFFYLHIIPIIITFPLFITPPLFFFQWPWLSVRPNFVEEKKNASTFIFGLVRKFSPGKKAYLQTRPIYQTKSRDGETERDRYRYIKMEMCVYMYVQTYIHKKIQCKT